MAMFSAINVSKCYMKFHDQKLALRAFAQQEKRVVVQNKRDCKTAMQKLSVVSRGPQEPVANGYYCARTNKVVHTGLQADIHKALKFLQHNYERYRKEDTDKVLLFWALKYNLTHHYFIHNKMPIKPGAARGLETVLKTSVHGKTDAGAQNSRSGVFPAGKLKGPKYATIKLY